MEPTIEQPTFDPLPALDGDHVVDTADRTELIEDDKRRKRVRNGESQSGESSPLHQRSTSSNTSILCAPQNYGLRVIIVSAIVFAVAVTVALILTIYLEPKKIRGHAAIVTSDERCSEHGLKILRAGGNAVDAAVAASFCLAVVAPQYSGLGGGGFSVVHDHKFTNTYAYDFHTTAPTGLTTSILKSADADSSIVSTGVPGLVKGLAMMHDKHGALPWKDMLAKSIDLAENGFLVSEDLAKSLRMFKKEQFTSVALADAFLKDGEFKDVNDTVELSNLAVTLKHIRSDPDTLYNGDLMTTFLEEMNSLKSTVTGDDIRNYETKKPDIIKSKIKDLTILGMPAPAGGPLLGLILNMAQKFDWKKDQRSDTKTYHQLIETFKFAFAQYSLLGDANVQEDILNDIKSLLSEDRAIELANEIDNRSYSDPSHYGPAQPFTDHGTAEHISVVDSSELMVSMTLSLNHLFGNRIMLPRTGILLNNQMMDFTLPNTTSGTVSSKNLVQPGKRPQSCMSPTIIYNDDHPCDRRVIIGGRRGPEILTGNACCPNDFSPRRNGCYTKKRKKKRKVSCQKCMAESIINDIIFKMDLSKAIAAPRVHNQLYPMVTRYEDAIPAQIVANLTQMGHNMKPANAALSVVNAIEKSNDDLSASADPRSFGAVERY